ncbi:MAG: TIGR00269 family protein [Thermoplasmata archaeon]|nr:TIGR00269 family protein [Thermoplasmata archaeon]
MVKCSKCGRDAVIYQPYSGQSLCERHFEESVLTRFKQELRRQGEFKRGKRIAVALSGGKDSSVLLHLLKRIFRERGDIELTAITVDEGIAGYRDISLQIAKRLTKKLGVEHVTVSFKEELGLTLDEMVSLQPPRGPCTYCGVFRRRLLNEAALSAGADYLALGHTLDDFAQSVLMNIFTADVKKLIRLGPHSRVREGFVPRILPMIQIPEKESLLYAILNNLEIQHEECPYAVRAHRGLYREILEKMEDAAAGTRHRIVKFHREVLPALLERSLHEPLRACEMCGRPTVGKVCKVCELKREIYEKKGA